MLKLVNIATVLFLFACTTGVEMNKINFSSLFHDGNSKVWMINRIVVSGEDFAATNNWEKDVAIFYHSGKCSIQPLKSLGESPGKKGDFSVYSDSKNLVIQFKTECWDFLMTTISEDKIIMKPQKNSDLKYTIELIPLPEL
jgi:hypothetical protein